MGCELAAGLGDRTYTCRYRFPGSDRQAMYERLESHYRSNGVPEARFRMDRGGIVAVRNGAYAIVQVFVGPTEIGIGSEEPIAAGEIEVEVLVRDAPG
jgi:hypothetical protein